MMEAREVIFPGLQFWNIDIRNAVLDFERRRLNEGWSSASKDI